jgi:cytosine/adenosine deaminase-related metal-dependent hydrolase
MMKKKILYGKYVIIDEKTIIPSGALCIEGDTVTATGPYDEIMKKSDDCEVIGSSDHLVMPGLVNAHGHGKGVTDFQRGHIDDTLETWKFRFYPPIDIYLDTLWTGVRLLESGVTTTMHNHNLVNPNAYDEEFETIIGAYLKSGIRLAFLPMVTNQNTFVYGDNDAFIRSLSPELQSLCRNMIDRGAKFGGKQYLKAVDDLYKKHCSEKIRILHGPLAPQWVSDDVLGEIRSHARAHAMRIHIHVQQTQLQKLCGLKMYGKSLLQHLSDIDFLGENVTCGHCVWLDLKDIDLLAATQTSVTHHASCNLRIRNGISPVTAMLEKGVVVALGLDDKEFGDSKDFFQEMRLASQLHRLSSHQLDSEHLKPKDCFRMATSAASEVLGFADLLGTLQPGKQADIVLVDLNRICEPFVSDDIDIIDLLIYRGLAVDVDTVLVAGEIQVQNGRHIKIDRKDLIQRLKAAVPEDYVEQYRQNNRLFPELRKHVQDYFASWGPEMNEIEKSPFYFMNNRY